MILNILIKREYHCMKLRRIQHGITILYKNGFYINLVTLKSTIYPHDQRNPPPPNQDLSLILAIITFSFHLMMNVKNLKSFPRKRQSFPSYKTRHSLNDYVICYNIRVVTCMV